MTTKHTVPSPRRQPHPFVELGDLDTEHMSGPLHDQLKREKALEPDMLVSEEARRAEFAAGEDSDLYSQSRELLAAQLGGHPIEADQSVVYYNDQKIASSTDGGGVYLGEEHKDVDITLSNDDATRQGSSMPTVTDGATSHVAPVRDPDFFLGRLAALQALRWSAQKTAYTPRPA